MSKRQIETVATDFEEVRSYFVAKGVISANAPQPQIAAARRIHRVTYSLILWRFRLKGIPDHGNVFLEEIASDALQVLPQILTGYSKTTKLLIRGIVENTWRHLYFKDHPVEFARMNKEKKYYISIDELSKYCISHPAVDGIEAKFDSLNRLSGLYDDLSAGVHGRRVEDLEMRVALNQLVFDQGALEEHAQFVERCGAAVNFILLVFHLEQFRSFDRKDRSAILQVLPAEAKKIVSGLE